MDNIPNEVLLHIIGYLNKIDIGHIRLVSERFNQLATTIIQKWFQVDIKDASDIDKFFSTFEQNETDIPFHKFGFNERLFAYPTSKHLKQFCVKYATFVKAWKILYDNSPKPLLQNSVSKNIKILFENCKNVEELSHSIFEEEIGKFMNVPSLIYLKTINITYFDEPTNPDFLPLLDEILQKAPNLRSVTIESRKCKFRPLKSVTSLLNLLHKTNGTVHIKKLSLTLFIPMKSVDELQSLVAISTKLGIVELNLVLIPGGACLEQLPTLEILTKWIEKLTFLSKLSVVVQRYWIIDGNGYRQYGVPIAIPLPSIARLRCLKVHYLHCPVVQQQNIQPMEFPDLTTLDCRSCNMTNQLSFSGCIFPNVKCASISLKSAEELQQWPLILPNVQDLEVVSETLKGIFRFSKLTKLHICISHSESQDHVAIDHWRNLTGGTEYISNNEICNFELGIQETSDSMESFRELPLLTNLKFSGENIGCWKGVIYASRTGQLRRLQRMEFSFIRFDEVKQYREILMKYHDAVIIPAPVVYEI